MVKEIITFFRKKNTYNFLVFLALFALSFLLFFKTLGFDFIIDDWTLLWVSKFHPELYGIYWSHPATVVEFFLLVKAFGVNTYIFNLFGIFLRALIGFVGYLFLSEITKSKKTGFIFSLLLVSSYIGLQSTTWTSSHIVSIDVILIVYTAYRYLLYLSSMSKKNFFIFLTTFMFSILADPGRNFPLIGLLLYLTFFQRLHLPTNVFIKRHLKTLILTTIITAVLFLLWYFLFGYFFHGIGVKHHTRIPFETIQYYFGSLINLLLNPYLRTFEFASITQSPLQPLYLTAGIVLLFIWLFTMYKTFQRKSLTTFILSMLLFWTFIFYIPSWISYPRLFVPAIHRYLTISGFGFLGMMTILLSILYKKNKILGILVACIIFSINTMTLQFHISQEATFRGKNIPDIWTKAEKAIPLSETNTIFYFTGDEPLLTWGIVYSEGNPYRLSQHITDPSRLIIVTNILEKVVNQLCHKDIQSLQALKLKESTLHFHSWHVTKDGNVTNVTEKELQNLEHLYEDKNTCLEVKKKYGDSFTYFN